MFSTYFLAGSPHLATNPSLKTSDRARWDVNLPLIVISQPLASAAIIRRIKAYPALRKWNPF